MKFYFFKAVFIKFSATADPLRSLTNYAGPSRKSFSTLGPLKLYVNIKLCIKSMWNFLLKKYDFINTNNNKSKISLSKNFTYPWALLTHYST